MVCISSAIALVLSIMIAINFNMLFIFMIGIRMYLLETYWRRRAYFLVLTRSETAYSSVNI